MDDQITQLIIEKINLEELNKKNSLNDTKQGDKGSRSMGVAETPKICILKRPKSVKATKLPRPTVMMILPEKRDKQSSQK